MNKTIKPLSLLIDRTIEDVYIRNYTWHVDIYASLGMPEDALRAKWARLAWIQQEGN